MTEYPYYTYLIAAFGIAVVLLVGLQPVAHRIGLVDSPNNRKHHKGEVPLIGGLAMFIAISLIMLAVNLPLSHLRAFFAGSIILILVGVLDDLHELSARTRFLAQIIATGIMATWGGTIIIDFGALLSDQFIFTLGWLALPVTIFSSIGVINSLNMVDGVDGLAGSVSLVAVGSMIIIAMGHGDIHTAKLLGIVGIVLFAFLLFNWSFSGSQRARVFMGDSGSMFLGFVLSWYFITLSQGENRAMNPVIALWLYAVPLNDTLTMMIRRIRKGRSPFSADREHFHHLLQMAGYSNRDTTLFMLGYAVIAATIGLLGWHLGIPEHMMFYLFLAVFAAHFAIVLRAWKVMRFLKRRIAAPKEFTNE